MKKKQEGFIKPVIVLVIICLVVGFGLAYVNSITDPIITKAAEEKAEQAKINVLPDADGFTEITDAELPEKVTSAFKADNGAGMVFICDAAGYNGNVEIIVGIGADGLITGTEVLDHEETVGLGSRIAGEDFRNQFIGQDSSLSGVQLIGGSTISSKCFTGMVDAAYEAYNSLS
jgi:electron transport complex protein RnfG